MGLRPYKTWYPNFIGERVIIKLQITRASIATNKLLIRTCGTLFLTFQPAPFLLGCRWCHREFNAVIVMVFPYTKFFDNRSSGLGDIGLLPVWWFIIAAVDDDILCPMTSLDAYCHVDALHKVYSLGVGAGGTGGPWPPKDPPQEGGFKIRWTISFPSTSEST
jgi:hypothetical protein